MSTFLFVYGTLKQGCSNHSHLAGQRFVGPARTAPGFRLYDFGGYPGIVAQADDPLGVVGEIWSVDDERLRHLDHFEGVHEGLYRRLPIRLQAPFNHHPIEAYFPGSTIAGQREIGPEWTE